MSTEIPVAATTTGIRFVDMSVTQQVVFVGKLIVFLCSFGFAFPTLLND